MKVLIPLAGWGTRLRPHTHTRPKPLVWLAGKPMLAFILDELAGLDVEELIFIVGHQGDQIRQYVDAAYPQYKTRYLRQTELLGQSHAIGLAKEYAAASDLLIIFPDTVFKADLATLADEKADAVLHLMPVENPARFGVAVVDNEGYITRLVEKPVTPVSNLAVVGVYYMRQAANLFAAIDAQVEQARLIKGEYFIAEAFEIMLEKRLRFKARNIRVWEDCGTLDALLQTNRYLLGQSQTLTAPEIPGSLLIPPLYIAPDAVIERSIVGPYASIAPGVRITDAIVADSIVGERTQITQAILRNSIVGQNCRVTGQFQTLNLGDDSTQG